jgi:hypothetical protein
MTFTVKLYGRTPAGYHTTRLVEALEVDIHILRPGELQEIAVRGPGGDSGAFYVADSALPRPLTGFAPEVDFWEQAYVENSAGKTTHSVRF